MKTRLFLHAWALMTSIVSCSSVPTSLAEELPSVGAMHVLNAYGIASHEEALALGLDSEDLRAMGIDRVEDRIAILKNNKDKNTKITPQDTRQDFHFVASYINSTRQYGKCINIIVKYRYPRGVYSDQSYIDYRDVRTLALHYAQPTEELPVETQWELVNMAFVQETFSKWNITGISSQIQVMSSQVANLNEPGNHGSTVTHGDIQPLGEPWINNFLYDCTRFNGPHYQR